MKIVLLRFTTIKKLIADGGKVIFAHTLKG